MCGADSAGLDPSGVPVALCPVAPGGSLLEDTHEHKTPVQALLHQTGDTLSKKNK